MFKLKPFLIFPVVVYGLGIPISVYSLVIARFAFWPSTNIAPM